MFLRFSGLKIGPLTITVPSVRCKETGERHNRQEETRLLIWYYFHAIFAFSYLVYNMDAQCVLICVCIRLNLQGKFAACHPCVLSIRGALQAARHIRKPQLALISLALRSTVSMLPIWGVALRIYLYFPILLRRPGAHNVTFVPKIHGDRMTMLLLYWSFHCKS